MKRALFLLCVFPILALATPSEITITGKVLDPALGTPKKATMTCRLSVPTATADGTIVAGEATVQLIAGALPSNWGLVPNDAMTPSGTKYICTVSAVLANGKSVSYAVQKQLFSTTNPIAFGSIPDPTYALNAAVPAAPPAFSPVSGTALPYQGSVTLYSNTPGALFYYTLNGSAPSTTSTPYTGPISMTASATIKAVAQAPGYSPGTISSATYTVAAAPYKNAILWAPFDVPGCYANGSTALAIDDTGSPVAMTYAGTGTKYFLDGPNTNDWASCATGQLRVSRRYGAMIERQGQNLLATPTDSPTSSGNWTLIAAGPTVTPNYTSYPFLDGTASASRIDTANAVTGLYQTTASLSAGKYALCLAFNKMPNSCVGFSLDGTTVHGKLRGQAPGLTGSKAALFYGTYTAGVSPFVPSGATYLADGFVAWVEPMGKDWTWGCVSGPLSAGVATPRFWVDDSDCNNPTFGAAASGTFAMVGRVQFISVPIAPAGTYAAAGVVRGSESVRFPISPATADLTCGAKIDFWPWGQAVRHGPLGNPKMRVCSFHAAAGETAGAHNSLELTVDDTGPVCSVYDNAGAVKTLSVAGPLGQPGDDIPHDIKCGVTASGTITISLDGQTTSAGATGAGTGILTSLPAWVYFGPTEAQGLFDGYSSALNVTDAVVCATGAAGTCGSANRTDIRWAAAIGDSITRSDLGTVTTTWTAAAEAASSGLRVANYAFDGARAVDFYITWITAVRPHRYGRVLVLGGINDLLNSATAAVVWPQLQRLYDVIASSGASPVLMTVLPTSSCNTACQTERAALNLRIKAYAAEKGYSIADCAPLLDNGSGALDTGTKCGGGSCDCGDTIHPSAAGMVVVGTCAAAALQ